MFAPFNLIVFARPNKKMRRKSCINFTKKLKSPETQVVSEVDETKPRKRFGRYSDSQTFLNLYKGADTALMNETHEDKTIQYDQEIEKLMKQVSKMTTEELSSILLTENDSVVDCILDQTKTVSH